MTWKILTIPAVLLVSGAFVAGACTIGTIEDDDFGGQGGEGGETPSTGGSTASGGSDNEGGASSGGSGTGGTVDFDCQADGTAIGDLASTEPDDNDDPCAACQKSLCSESFARCLASDPDTACYYGSTTLYGTPLEGETTCLDSCIQQEAAFDPDSVDFCADLCGSDECLVEGEPSRASPVTVDLWQCVVGDGVNADCSFECWGVD